MSITIQSKNDYSFLFSSLGSSSSSSNVASSNFLSQYASIKNGSYAKLMKAYYAETGSSKESVNSLVNKTESSDDAKTIAKVQTTADALKESADALLESKAETTEEMYSAVSDFVKDYNSVIDAVNQTENSTIVNRTTNLANSTMINYKSLNAVGITINEDSTLSIDKDTFLKADVSKVKSLFSETGSYGYRVSAQSSLINFAADHEANKNTTYTLAGNYTSTFLSGNLFSTYF